MHLYIWLITVFHLIISYAEAQSQDSSCPELLDCGFPKKKIEYVDPETNCLHRVCTCQGTKNGLSSSGASSKQWYNQAKMRYTNCTLVDGNLELSGIGRNVTFTKHIQQVTGHIIITRVSSDFIDLSSLRLIRGITLHPNPPQPCKNSGLAKKNVTEYALFVIDNNGLKELRMPNLSEITRGNVLFLNNKNLCYVNTVLWKEEILIDYVKQNVEGLDPNNFKSCPSCPETCRKSKKSSCWGSSSNLCQLMTKTICPDCKQGCVETSSGTTRCCDADCAGGCFHHYSSGCYACRKVSYNGECKESCPSGTKPNSGGGLITDADTVLFAGFCLKECPPDIPLYDKFCQTFCPRGTYDYKNNVCDECENKTCNNICYGLGVKHGGFANETYVNANNIKQFNKNCTIIEGSLHFKKASFSGDPHCKVDKLNHNNKAELERFENVREITGYLAIEEWTFRDICVFKNLERIHGKELFGGQFALSVFTNNSPDSASLRSLCFNSLKTIDKGDVYVRFNRGLCYAKKIRWKSFFLYPTQQKAYTKARKDCTPCSSNCDSSYGCWGSLSEQCGRCRNYTDLTNANGKVVPEWIVDDNGNTYPGNNVSTCVEECDFSKGVYPSSDQLCLPCDDQCAKECTGPGPTQCKACRNYTLDSSCVSECPSLSYFKRNQTCLACSKNCLDLGCNGPLDEYDTNNGCHSCHYSFDNATMTATYRGRICDSICKKQFNKDCSEGCEETNGVSRCIVLPSSNTAAIVIPLVLVVIVPVVIILICLLRKNKTTIKKMRKTIGDNVVGERDIDDEERMPLTPSGAPPNQAQLRIVNDDELLVGSKLGSGAFGEVHKAIWTPMNIQGEKIKIAVAVKTLKVLKEVESAANQEIMEEAYVMASVDCDYLVRLLGIRLTKTVSLITQLMPLGNLLEYVRDVKQQDRIHSRQILTWFVQIAKGMLYLQEKHLVHRDLAARNVLVKTPNHVKITDFGLAKMLDIKEDYYQAEGGKLPIKWLAIECITERLFSHHSDVWAYGITCWEILTFGARPYEGVYAADILQLLERGERLLQPPAATIDVYMLLIKCWMVDRTCRPSFAELVDEFSRMATDPSRYLVVKNDSGNCMSPNQIEEDKFFQMLMQEEKIDDALITDEPDQYLLNRDLTNQRAMYANQETVNKAQDSHQTNNAPERLFSRSTPSAVIESTAASASLTTGVRSAEPTTRLPSTSDQDDVFAESSKQLNHVDHRVEVHDDRKDSEESHRYTEDPTYRKPMRKITGPPSKSEPFTSASKFSYDESDYLLPTSNDTPRDFPSPQPSALTNDTYVESPPYQSGPPSSRSHGPSDPTYTPLATCEEQEEHDYMNANGGASKNFFANEEYMVTGADSGIGEDSQSLLSRDTRAKQEKRSEWEQSVSSDENEQISIKDTSVQFKPESSNGTKKNSSRNPWSVSSDASSSSHNSSNAINNPGYIFLDASTSNSSNNNQNNNGKPV